VVLLTNNNKWDEDPAWSPDGSRIAFTSGFEIYVMDADGSNAVNLTNNRFENRNPAWSP